MALELGEFYRLLFWKFPSLVGVLIGIRGGQEEPVFFFVHPQ